MYLLQLDKAHPFRSRRFSGKVLTSHTLTLCTSLNLPAWETRSCTNTEHVSLQHPFSIQNELGRFSTLPPSSKNLKTAVSADCMSEMLIYIRHGTFALQSKSAEKWSEVESKAPSSQLCQVSGLPDQRMAGFGTSDQRTDISLRKQNSLALLHVKNRFDRRAQVINDRAGERSGTVLEPVTTGVWQVPSGTKIETAGRFNETAAPVSISAGVWGCVHAFLSVCACFFFFFFHFLASISVSLLDGGWWTILPRKYQGLPARGYLTECVFVCARLWLRMCLCR